MTNVRLALRMFVKAPVVTGVAVLSLALGIGSNAAIFSLYSQFLLRPLPVVAPERLVNLEAPGPKPGSDSCTGQGGCDEVFSYPMFRDLQREQTVFTDLVAHRGFGASVAHEGRTIDIVQGMQVSGSYFPTLGLVPALGRLFGPEVDEPIGGHPVAVLSHAFWQTQLGGAGDVVGDVLLVNGQPLTIVGVAPAGFRGTAFNMPSMVFVPLAMHARLGGGFGDGPLRGPPELLALPVRPPAAGRLHRAGPRCDRTPVPEHPDRRGGAAPDGHERRHPGAVHRQAAADRGRLAGTERRARGLRKSRCCSSSASRAWSC